MKKDQNQSNDDLPQTISDEDVVTLKNKIEMVLSEFGLKDYAMCVKCGPDILQLNEVNVDKDHEVLQIVEAMNNLQTLVAYSFLDNFKEDEMAEIKVTKLICEMEMHSACLKAIGAELIELERIETEEEKEEQVDEATQKLLDNLNPDREDEEGETA